MCQGESCHGGLASLCKCVSVRKTTFMYVCVRLHLCMCVWDYIHICVWDYINVCETTFMYVCLKLHLCVCLRLHSRMFVWTMCTKNLSNYEITKIKVVDLHELFNFGIHYFFSWNDLGVQIMVSTCLFSNFKIWKVQI